MPKLEIYFYPDPLRLNPENLNELTDFGPFNIFNRQGRWYIENTDVSIYITTPNDNQYIANHLQKQLENFYKHKQEIDKDVKILENSAK